MKIFEHVYHFKTSARIELLALLLLNETQIRNLMLKYPVEIDHPTYRAVMFDGDTQGFTFDGWVDALWQSL